MVAAVKIYIVIERNSGDIEAVYMSKADAESHAEEFFNSDMYDMTVVEHVIQNDPDWKIV